MGKTKMVRAKMKGNYPYSLNGIDELLAKEGAVVDLTERHFKIAKGKGLAERAEKGAKTEADHAEDKAAAVADKAAAAVSAGGEEALQKIIDDHDEALKKVSDERDGLLEKIKPLEANYGELLALCRKHVPEKDLDAIGKTALQKLIDFGKGLLG